MLITTLGYLEQNGAYLMLHRTKKKNDINHDKWIGIGGKLENGETILACMQRECLEETGLVWDNPQLKGIIAFNYQKDDSSEWFYEQMFLYTGGTFFGEMKNCREGHLEWVPAEKISSLPLWKGDLIFLHLMQENVPLFYLELNYIGDTLTKAVLNNEILDLEDPATYGL